jgi:hypothetical protein
MKIYFFHIESILRYVFLLGEPIDDDKKIPPCITSQQRGSSTAKMHRWYKMIYKNEYIT